MKIIAKLNKTLGFVSIYVLHFLIFDRIFLGKIDKKMNYEQIVITLTTVVKQLRVQLIKNWIKMISLDLKMIKSARETAQGKSVSSKSK